MSVDTRELAGMAQDAFEAKDYGKAVITLESLGKERSSDPKVRERRERERAMKYTATPIRYASTPSSASFCSMYVRACTCT